MITNALSITINKDIPPPPDGAKIASQILAQMETGDSFELPENSEDFLEILFSVAEKEGCHILSNRTQRLFLSAEPLRIWLMAKRKFPRVCDSVNRFLEEMCEIDKHAKTGKAALYRTYTDWATITGDQSHISRNMLAREITKAGFKLDSSERYRLGLRLKPAQNKMQGNEIIA